MNLINKAASVLSATCAALLFSLTSCSPANEGWSVSGKVGIAADSPVTLEAVDNGHWSVIDSATVASDGTFKFNRPRADYPDIYRVNIGGRVIYFPVDSIENIVIEAEGNDFDRHSRISGSASADAMQRINDLVMAVADSRGELAIATDSVLKRQVADIMQADWGGIVSYYAINKSVGSTPIFDASQRFDRRIISAVANAFSINHPDDPRTEMLRRTAIDNTRAFSTSAQTYVASEAPFPDIRLHDQHGEVRSLADEWADSRVTVLNFTLYNVNESAAVNMKLNELYTKYADRGLRIYQVVCDEDEYRWLQAAQSIPWTSVFNGGNATNLLNYNVQSVPTTFVIDKNADRMERIDDLTRLESAITRMI